VLGFADAGGRTSWSERVGLMQGLGEGPAGITMWWLVGRQDFFQLELFHHTRPAQRPLPGDWRPSDLGWGASASPSPTSTRPSSGSGASTSPR